MSAASIEIIANKYRVLKVLGTGAMGEVFLVMPPKGDPVALKLIRTLDTKANSEAVDQFENEFRTLKRLAHPNIGQIYDYGYDETLQKVFFTLPWLKGTDIFEATKSVDYDTAEDLFVQALRALHYLHQKNLIHCDLKPGNIYVESGKVLLIDFGLAGYWGENIVGTPTYLAPEVFRGTHHNVRSDLYAMGVIMYNCLTRNQPFSGSSLQEVFNRHRSFTPPPLHELNPNIPKYMSDIVLTLLNKKPEERFQSAADVIAEIDAYSKNSYSIETTDTLMSYLPTESDIVTGHQEAIEDIQVAIREFKNETNNTPYHIICIHGPKNVGKNKIVAHARNGLQLSKTTVENILPPLSDQDKQILLGSKAIIFENIDSYYISGAERLNLKQVIDITEQKILSTTTSKFMLILSATQEKEFDSFVKLFPEEESQLTKIKLKPYTKQETEEFLKKITGQPEIPAQFVDQFYRNTEGMAGIAVDLIQSMISKGLLFEKSGKWSEDLLTELERAFEGLEFSETLEQEFEKQYNSLTGDEEDIVNWLALCPHPLHFNQLYKLTQLEGIDRILDIMIQKNLLKDDDRNYTLYRTVFKNFIEENLSKQEKMRRHTLLALPKIGLDKKWALHHLSYGDNKDYQVKALEKLIQIHKADGDRENALECCLRLIRNFPDQDFNSKLDWHIEASTLMVWLDQYQQAIELITSFEKMVQQSVPQIDHNKFLTLLEKKGIALMHLHKLDKAKLYFEKGLSLSTKFNDAIVERIRFENNLAELEFLQGHNEEAIRIFTEARQKCRTLTTEQLLKITNNDLGHVHLHLKNYEKSKTNLIEDIKILSNLKFREPLARALYSLGDVLRLTGETEHCIKVLKECMQICKDQHIYPLLLRTYNSLGNIYLATGDNDEALKLYQRALDLTIRLQEQTSKAALLYNQGFIYIKQNNLALATRKFLMAKNILENKSSKLLGYEEMLLSRCLADLSSISFEGKNHLKALSFQLERLKYIESSDSIPKTEKFSARCKLAELYLEARLMDQFESEVKTLRSLAETDDEKQQILKLTERLEQIQNLKEQDSTGVLSSVV